MQTQVEPSGGGCFGGGRDNTDGHTGARGDGALGSNAHAMMHMLKGHVLFPTVAPALEDLAEDLVLNITGKHTPRTTAPGGRAAMNSSTVSACVGVRVMHNRLFSLVRVQCIGMHLSKLLRYTASTYVLDWRCMEVRIWVYELCVVLVVSA